MINLKQDAELYQALRTLATGATIEEIGKESDGSSKLLKRKLPPNFDAIKFIYENESAKINMLREWKPSYDSKDQKVLPNTNVRK